MDKSQSTSEGGPPGIPGARRVTPEQLAAANRLRDYWVARHARHQAASSHGEPHGEPQPVVRGAGAGND